MKATGIVRRIDDLGRVVIPKEIRRTLRIREGDPLEIFVDRDGEVILKKYSPISELGDFAKEYAEALFDSLGNPILICDRDTYITIAGGSKKDFLNKSISDLIEKTMEGRTSILINQKEKYRLSKAWKRKFPPIPLVLSSLTEILLVLSLFTLKKVH